MNTAKTGIVNIKNFTIRDLERFSGIKAHTLRIWELRYALLTPMRSSNNFRYYTLEELRKILSIALLKRHGYKIAALSKMPVFDLEEKTALLTSDIAKWQKAIHTLTINMYTLDPKSFESALDQLLLKWPMQILIEKIIFPFLALTGLLWMGNKLYEEHLVVTAIRKKLIYAIESARNIVKADKAILLFLPDAKQLDLGLLYANYFLKRIGAQVLYLGDDVTIENLKIIFQIYPPAYLFTYLQKGHNFPKGQLLQFMRSYAPEAKLIIGKYPSNPVTPLLNGNLIELNYQDALDFLAIKINAYPRNK